MRRGIWTEPEIEKLKSMLLHAPSLDELIAAFPSRSVEGMKLKAQKLGVGFSKKCDCGRLRASLKDGLCTVCRNLHKLHRVKYPWNPQWDAELMRLNNCRGRNEWSAVLRHVSGMTGVPIPTIKTHCGRLNIFFFHRSVYTRPWTIEEDAELAEMASEKSVSQIAAILKRSETAISVRIHKIGMSQRVTDGYSQKDIAEVLGVATKTVRKWIDRGWLGDRKVWASEHHRISEEELWDFIHKHPEQYELRRVDDAWFKGMMFPKFGMLGRVKSNSISQGATQ